MDLIGFVVESSVDERSCGLNVVDGNSCELNIFERRSNGGVVVEFLS